MNQYSIISQMAYLCGRKMKMKNEVFWSAALNWFLHKLLI